MSDVPVEGQVVVDGETIEGASVIGIDDTNGEFIDTAVTGTDGWYELLMPGDTVAHIKLEYRDPDTNQYIQSQSKPFIPVEELVEGTASFDINYDGPGIDFTSLTSQSWMTQAVCYSMETSQWYVGEVTDSSTPSTIHEFNEDGSTTGESFQFSTGSPTPNHANSLQWHDGHLWCAEYNSDTVYKIDWSSGTVAGSFSLGNGTVDSDKLGVFTFVPTQAGDYKMLVTMWGSAEQNAYLVNYQDAITDGTASGNIYLTLSDTVDTGRVQGCFYHDGALYVNSDALPNGNPPADTGWGSYPTYKLDFPLADELSAGDDLMAGRYLWCWLNADIPYDDPIQDIGLNPDSGTFWTATESTNTIFSGTESDSINRLPDAWNDWNLEEFSGPDEQWQQSLVLDNSVASGKRDQHIFYQGQSANVEVWIHDDLADQGTSDDKRAYVSVATPENQHNDTEIALAINSVESSSDFVSWNSNDGWHSTGVTRPSSPQWVKFRWELTGSETNTYISKDGGETWESGGTYTSAATELGVLQPQVSTGAPTYLGPFTVEPIP